MNLCQYNPPESFVFEYLPRTTSTNDIAFERGAGHIVCAASQSEGRGRLGRAYSCEEGGLYFSVATQFPCEPAECMALPAVAALCVQQALGSGAKIKWPNDIFIDGKKVCGILTESRGDTVVFGFGINLKNPLPADLTEAGYAQGEAAELLEAVVTRLLEALAGYPANRAELLQQYGLCCLTLGKFVNVTYRGMPLCGFACAIDFRGGLMVMTQESRIPFCHQ